MANFVCDICGGKLTMQSGGVGVCSQCGMEYSNERLREMAGAAPAQAEPKKAEAPAKTEDSKIKNYLTLAEHELNAGLHSDTKKALEYCDKVLELDIDNFDAWYLKAQLELSCSQYAKALNYAVDLYHREDISGEQKNKTITLIDDVTKKYMGSYMGTAWSLIVPDIACLADVEEGRIYVDVVKKVFTGLHEKLQNASKRVDEYNEKEYMWKTEYFAHSDGDFVLREVREVVRTVSEVSEKMQVRLADPMIEIYKEASQVYRRLSELYYDGGNYLDELKKKDSSDAGLYGDILNKIYALEDAVYAEKQRLEELEYQKRLAKGEEYWSKYPEEKKQLEDELEKTAAQWDALGACLEFYEKDGPSETEIKKQITACKNELAGLSIFKGKEKKVIKEKIVELEKALQATHAERMEKKAEVQKEYDTIDKKYEDLSNLLIDGR